MAVQQKDEHFFKNVSRLEDEIAIVRKDEQNDVEQIKKQIFNLRDELTNQRASYVPQIDSAKEGFQTLNAVYSYFLMDKILFNFDLFWMNSTLFEIRLKPFQVFRR